MELKIGNYSISLPLTSCRPLNLCCLIHVNRHVTCQKLQGLHHCRYLATILIHLDHVNSLLWFYHLAHLIVLFCQNLQLAFNTFLINEGLCMGRILFLQRIYFDLHVLNTEVLELKDFTQLRGQVWIPLIYAEGRTSAITTRTTIITRSTLYSCLVISTDFIATFVIRKMYQLIFIHL